MTPTTYNAQDCRFFHFQARFNLAMARGERHHRLRLVYQGRAADYRECLIDQMRRRAGWTLAERIANRRT